MLDTIKAFFNQKIAVNHARNAEDRTQRLQLATAVLLMEVARADYADDPREIAAVAAAIRKTFPLSADETEQLLTISRQEAEQATSYHEFTNLIHQAFSPEEKITVIENMWQVAFSDGHLDKYEEHFIRKIADLLYVKHSDFIAAKHRARSAHPPQPDSGQR